MTVVPPPAVATLLDSLGRGEVDVSGFAPGATYAWSADREREMAPRAVARGADLGAAVADDVSPATSRVVVHVSVESATDCLLEASLVDRASGERMESWYASFQLAGGLVTRALTYRCPPVDPSATWGDDTPTTHSAAAAVDGYFRDLDAARLEAAAGWFSGDVLYSHPPYFPGAPRAEFRGMAELLAGFEHRGPRTNHHEIAVCLQRGRECLVEGWSHKPDRGVSGQFVSSLSLDDDGRIRRYVALYCEPGVGRA